MNNTVSSARKVYVLNAGPHDFSDAERFGELVFCTEGSISKYDVSEMYRELHKALSGSDAKDYILLTSLTSLCSVACSIFTHLHGELHLLIHKNSGYVERSIYFDANN